MSGTDDRRDDGGDGRDDDYRDDYSGSSSSSGSMTTIAPPPFDVPGVTHQDPMGGADEYGDGIEEVLPSDRPRSFHGPADHGDIAGAEPELDEELSESPPAASSRRPRKAAARKKKASRKRARRHGADRRGRSPSPEPGAAIVPPPLTTPSVPAGTAPTSAEPPRAATTTGFAWRPWMTYAGGGLLGLIILIVLIIALGGGSDDTETSTAADSDQPIATEQPAPAVEPEPDDPVADAAAADQTGDAPAVEDDDTATDEPDPAAGDDPDAPDADPQPDDATAPTAADRTGDTFDCATGDAIDRPDIDIESMSSRIEGDRIRTWVDPIGDPLRLFETSWSGALSSDHVAKVTRTTIGEKHADTARMGEVDPATGDVIEGTADTVELSASGLVVDAPVDAADPPVLAVGRTFQTPNEGDATGCDIAMVAVTPYPYADLVTAGSCTPNGVACVNAGRFSVAGTESSNPLEWSDAADGAGAVAPTADGGSIQVNLIPACGINERVWALFNLAGGTEVTVTVTDTVSGEALSQSVPPDGNPVVDTDFFASCAAGP